ncbi:NAD(P)H-binding protein [Streptomyces sp. SID8499]|uniref:NAD(P)H-binding protein n=1 Tax=Streptomyces sp. SID8499 TaxID=2706106 RepID=UPI0013C6468A|nr:NAD(P)H-binding protein [Streptomyces sp. SID8499]NED36817.1 NAD(P)H-binding protein [Streptomyces sp. SID8499]
MIVVTGATGNIGRTLVPLLAAAGEDVAAVSRGLRPAEPAGAEPAGAEPVGVESTGAEHAGADEGVRRARAAGRVRHVQADVGDATTLRPVLDGADALFVLLGGELNSHGESPHALPAAAADAGVKRIVLLSSQGSATRPDAPSHARLRAFEAAVRAAGPDFTILRPGAFASNAFAWTESVRTRRTVHAPFGDVALPVIDPADIAEVAAAALREGGHAGRTYELTGPAAISPREQVAVLSAALGEEVAFAELTREEARARMTHFMPEEVADGTLDILGAPLPSEQRVSPDVRDVLGRPARPFAQWVARNLPAFR